MTSPDVPDWLDPTIVGWGREPMSAHRSRDEIGLDGQWHFLLTASPESSPSDWHARDLDDSEWSRIAVPANWQLTEAGSDDIPIYTNVQYPWPADPPKVPSENPHRSLPHVVPSLRRAVRHRHVERHPGDLRRRRQLLPSRP